MEGDPTPELFVARDRARRFSRRVRDALTERRLTYKGAAVGMETLVDRADRDLASVIEDIDATIADVEGRRIRDRERGYMEVPLLVMAEGVRERVHRARQIEHARLARALQDPPAIRAVLTLLDDALTRIDAYCAAYDAKQPVGPVGPVDLGRVLERVERDRLALRPAAPAAPTAFDRPPPQIRTDGHVVSDLLRAVRAAADDLEGPWRVSPAEPGHPLTLALGDPEGLVRVDAPERVTRAIALLSHLHPVQVRCLAGRADAAEPDEEPGLLSEPRASVTRIGALSVMLADDAAASLATVLAGCAGADAALRPGAETAVRALLAASPPSEDGPPPPDRAVAWMGILRVVDEEIVRTLPPRAKNPACRVQASQLPRESTRKAPVKRDLLLVLGQTFEGFPSHRLGDVAKDVADGRLGARLAPADAAVLLAAVARTWRYGGRSWRRAMALDPLSDADVEELIQDLTDHAQVRKALESGQAVDAGAATRFERASIAVLGRLGRLP